MNELTELSQLVLGAYAMADTHTLSATQVVAMSNGALDADEVSAAMKALHDAGYSEVAEQGAYRLTREGIEHSLKLQAALAPRD